MYENGSLIRWFLRFKWESKIEEQKWMKIRRRKGLPSENSFSKSKYPNVWMITLTQFQFGPIDVPKGRPTAFQCSIFHLQFLFPSQPWLREELHLHETTTESTGEGETRMSVSVKCVLGHGGVSYRGSRVFVGMDQQKGRSYIEEFVVCRREGGEHLIRFSLLRILYFPGNNFPLRGCALWN